MMRASTEGSRVHLGLSLIVLACVLVSTAGVFAITRGPSASGAVTSIADPAVDIAPQPDFSSVCAATSLDQSSGCQSAVLAAIDHARRAEGLAPLNLPTDFDQLSPGEQLFAVADLERVARGLAPFTAMTADLDATAQSGAVGFYDPSPSAQELSGGSFVSNWAAGMSNALAADYFWMYDDGWGGAGQTFNSDCTSPDAAGCWGHRNNILVDPSDVGCVSNCSLWFGGAEASSSTGWPTSFAEVFLLAGQDPPSVFSWSQVLADMGPTEVPCAAPASPSGYRAIGSDGSAFVFGNLPYCGGMSNAILDQPIVGGAATPDGGGYWLVASDGGVFTFGDARFDGSEGGQRLNAPIVGMAATPGGGGYWLVASDGGVFTFGDARFDGSEGGRRLAAPIVGMAATPDGGGYWLVASDGGVFTFGDARYDGSEGGQRLNAPIVGMAATPGGGGYWLVASDGGVFSFGNARYDGSEGGQALVAPIVGLTSTLSGSGYWLVASDGGVFSFGDAPFDGSLGADAPPARVTALVGP